MKIQIKPILLLLLALILGLYIIKVGNFVDEDDYVLGGCLLSKGQIIYTDFFSHHFPLPYYILNLVYTLFECSLDHARLFILLAIITTFYYLYLVSKNWLYLVLLNIYILISPYYFGNYFLSETFVGIGLLLILSLTFYLNPLKNTIYFYILFLGSLLLLWSSQIGILIMSIFIVHQLLFFRQNKEVILKFITTIFSALTLGIIVLFLRNNLSSFFENAVYFNLIYYSQFLVRSLINPVDILLSTLEFLRDKFNLMGLSPN